MLYSFTHMAAVGVKGLNFTDYNVTALCLLNRCSRNFQACFSFTSVPLVLVVLYAWWCMVHNGCQPVIH